MGRVLVLIVALLTVSPAVADDEGSSGGLGCLRDIVGDRTLNCAIRCSHACADARGCIRSLTRQIRKELNGNCTQLFELIRNPSDADEVDADARAAMPEIGDQLNHAQAVRHLWLDLDSSLAVARRRCN
jgi:hypothetical protein